MNLVARQGIAARMRGLLHRVLSTAAAGIEPRAPGDLEQRLARGDVVWQAFLDAGRALVRVRRFEEADEALRRALAAFPGDGDLLIEYAMSTHESGRYGLAVDRWTAALAAAPDVAMCHAGLAANLRMTGDSPGATRVIDAAFERFPGDLLIVTEAARCAEQRGQFDAARDLWETACATPDPHPDWLCGRAHALVMLGRFGEAGASVQSGRRTYPEHRGFMAVEGLLATAREDWPVAIAVWTDYRKKFPDDRTGSDHMERAIQANERAQPDG